MANAMLSSIPSALPSVDLAAHAADPSASAVRVVAKFVIVRGALIVATQAPTLLEVSGKRGPKEAWQVDHKRR